MDERVNGLVVANDAESRMRLKAVTASVYTFEHVQLCPTTREAASYLSDGYEWNVVFISSDFENSKIAEFIKLGRSSSKGRDAAYILLTGAGDQTKTAIAENVLLGVDGMLCSPYSAESLVELSRLAQGIKRERMRERKEAAVRLLADDAAMHLDGVAWAMVRGQAPGTAARSLRELGATLKGLEPEWRPVFIEALTARCEQATPFVRPKPTASKRVQQKIDQQVPKSNEGAYRIVKR